MHIHIRSIVAHSNQVTAMVALHNTGVRVEEIAYQLHWNPDSVKHYFWECTHQIGNITMATVMGAHQISFGEHSLLPHCPDE